MGLLLYRFGMRTARRHPIRVVTVTAALVLVLAGCTQPSPEPTPTPSPAPNPVFASDEEALAAAQKAYADYLAMSDLIFQEGGRQPERLKMVATDAIVESESAAFAEIERNGWRSDGATRFDSATLQAATYTGWSSTSITIYACSDVSGLDVLDPAGNSVVSADRPARQSFELTFVGSPDERLLLDEKELWEGAGVC